MRPKTIALLTIGGSVGFAGGVIFSLQKILKSDKMSDALSDVISDKIEGFLYEIRPTKVKRKQATCQRYSYSTAEDMKWIEVFFASCKDARDTLEVMRHVAKEYGSVSVMDYYDICDVEADDYTSTDSYGWNESDLSRVTIVKFGDNYYVPNLPAAHKLR